MQNETPDAILAFWFDETTRPLWFNATPEFDQQLRDRFLPTWRAARDRELEAWKESATGCLALVIVLDQFPLNMFRGQAESFATEAQSREVAAHAIDNGLDAELEGARKAFLYLPFMHSENLLDQERSVMLFEQAGLKDNLRWAHHHYDLIKRFGRFPHRNAALQRESTEAERAYLASEQAFKG